MKDGKQWRYTEGDLAVRVTGNHDNFFPVTDIRAIGLFPTPHGAWTAAGELNVPVDSYELTTEGDSTIIVARCPNNETIKWWLDEEQGGQPVRSAYFRDNQLVAECRSRYHEWDGLWFPAHLEYWANGETVKTITITSASFSEPFHAHRLTASDLGVVPGVNIFYPPDEVPDPHMWYAWDGSGVVDLPALREKVKRGEVDVAAFNELRKRHRGGAGVGRYPRQWEGTSLGLPDGFARKPGLWEEYVRRFIQRHRLNTERARKAWEFLRKAQKPAYRYLEEHRDELRDLENELAAAPASQPASQPAGGEKPKSRAERKYEVLCAPIEKMFESLLKPPLKRLAAEQEKERGRTAPVGKK